MARHRLRPHENAMADAPLPTMAELSPQIERDEATGGHWYWLGDFSAQHEAVLLWTLPGAAGSKRTRRTRFAVARLLMQLQGTFVPGSGVLNECGLVQCVNPSHWSLETRQDRGQAMRIVVLTDFHGKGWTNKTRSGPCEVCFRAAEDPCDPRMHDAEFRRVLNKSEERCDVCNAAPYQDCDETVHRQVFAHALSKPSLERRNIAGQDHIVHRAVRAPQEGWFFRACDARGGGQTIYAIEQKHLTSAPVSCIACLGSV